MIEQNAVEAVAAVESTASKAMTWLSSNQELMIQYSVNIVTALVILLVGNWLVKKVAGSVALKYWA